MGSIMGVDTGRLYLITSALGGALAGLASCLLVLQYDVHPFVGLSFGPITFLICVLGGLGNFVGGFVAAFVFAEIISLGDIAVMKNSKANGTGRALSGISRPGGQHSQTG